MRTSAYEPYYIMVYEEQNLINHSFFSLPHNLLNPFPNNKILDLTKLEAFADDKLNVTKVMISVFDRVKNIVGKKEIACTSNFSFSHNVFKRLLSQTRQKVSLCGNGLTFYLTITTFNDLV